MISLKRYKTGILLPIGISLLIHFLLLISSSSVFVSGGAQPSPRKKRVFKIKTLKSNIPKRVKVKHYVTSRKEILKFETPKLNTQQLESRNASLRKKSNKDLLKKKKILVNQGIVPDSMYFNEFLGIKKEEKGPDFKKERSTRKSILKASDLIGSNNFVKPDDVLVEISSDNEFYEKMPGFTPQLSSQFIDSTQGGGEAVFDSKLTGAVRPSQGRNDLKEYFVSNIDV
ncbi:hypothetical protein MNBD_BACTEROID05-58, partial [hydrothermal vent metagenome]